MEELRAQGVNPRDILSFCCCDRVGRGLTPQADEAAAEDMDVGCQDGILERRRTNGISRMAVDLINGAKEVQWRKITDPQPVNFHCRNEFKMGEEYPYRLTNGQYRQLTKQVKDINFQVANKYRPNVDYRRPSGGASTSSHVLYRGQLASSLNPFKSRPWRPAPPPDDDDRESLAVKCRPATCRRPSVVSRQSSAAERPSTVPEKTGTPPTRERLKPAASQPEVCDTLTARATGTMNNNNNNKQARKAGRAGGQRSADREEVRSGGENAPAPGKRGLDADWEPERTRDEIEETRREKLFDFDARTVSVPLYLFKDPLPSPYDQLDFGEIGADRLNWRGQADEKSSLHSIINRVLELHRLQQETEEIETRKLKQFAKSRKALSSRQSTGKSRERRCHGDCVQPACLGECPEKGANETGSDYAYELHARMPREETRPWASANHRKCANGCLLNASDSASSGRPKSSQCLAPADLEKTSGGDCGGRPLLGQEAGERAEQKRDKLSAKAVQKTARSRSRSGLPLGKSYSSHRRWSLTPSDKQKCTVTRATTPNL